MTVYLAQVDLANPVARRDKMLEARKDHDDDASALTKD
jgi:hypothetical protein